MECQAEAGSEGEVAADTLRANSNYASNEYFLPVMGIRRQRMVVIDTLERRVVASTEKAYYYQPESFSAGLLVATKEPFHSAERVIWHVPEDLAGFKPVSVAWTEAAQQDVSLHESSDRLSLCEVGRFSSQEMIHER